MPVNNSAKFQQAAEYFESSIDTSKDPCNDFYAYACGNYNNDLSFDIVDYSNFNKTAWALKAKNDSDVRFLVDYILPLHQKSRA